MSDYEVRRGDNLWKIVRNMLKINDNAEIQKKVKEIAELNNISNINSIFVGQHIKLSAKEETPEKPKEKVPDRSLCFVFGYKPSEFKCSYPDVYFSKMQRSAASSAPLHTTLDELKKPKTETQTVTTAQTTSTTEASSVQANEDKVRIQETAEAKPKVQVVSNKKKVATSASLRNFDVTTKFEGTAEQIEKHLGGVLKGHGKKFLELQDKYGINAVFLAAITINESENGTSYSARKRNNVGGIRYKNSYRFRTYNNVSECLDDMADNLKDNYINEGRTTVARIGSKYCPVNDKSDKEGLNKFWARNVSFYMKRIINNNV